VPVLVDEKTALARDVVPQVLDLFALELEDLAAAGADHVVVAVVAAGLVAADAAVELVALGQPGLLAQLHGPVDRGHAYAARPPPHRRQDVTRVQVAVAGQERAHDGVAGPGLLEPGLARERQPGRPAPVAHRALPFRRRDQRPAGGAVRRYARPGDRAAHGLPPRSRTQAAPASARAVPR
jgi:hypothetical protein